MTMIGYDKPCRCARWQLVVSLSLAIPLLSPVRAQAKPPAGTLLVLGVVGQADVGTIKGRLVWGGEQVSPTEVLQAKGKAAKDPDVCARNQSILSHDLEIDPKTKGVAYGFAYLTRPKANNPEMVQELITLKPKVEIDQKNCDFLPHSVALHQDQTLTLKSSDAVGHNVRLTGFANAGVNQVLAPNGQLGVKLVAERLPMRLACDIHPWMHGHVMVFDHPFFAVTGSGWVVFDQGGSGRRPQHRRLAREGGICDDRRGPWDAGEGYRRRSHRCGRSQDRSREGQIAPLGTNSMWRYRIGRSLQFLGLLILPFAIASELVGEFGLGQSMLVAAAGAALFYVGFLVQNRP